MKIIGLRGPKQSGKDYICDKIAEFVRAYGAGLNKPVLVEKAAFATPGKLALASMFGLSTANLFGTDEQKNLPTPLKWRLVCAAFKTTVAPNKSPNDFITHRELTILFLNEVMKGAFSDSVWLVKMGLEIAACWDSGVDYFLISDVRWDVEAKWLMYEMNAEVWMIDGRSFDPKASHASEVEMRDSPFFTKRIKNNVDGDHWLALQLSELLGLSWPAGFQPGGSNGNESVRP